MILREKGIDRSSVQGYDRGTDPHGNGDPRERGDSRHGLGYISCIADLDLDFIPLMEEEYDLLVTKEFSETPGFGLIMELLTSTEFASRLGEMGGYNTKESGKIKYVNR